MSGANAGDVCTRHLNLLGDLMIWFHCANVCAFGLPRKGRALGRIGHQLRPGGKLQVFQSVFTVFQET